MVFILRSSCLRYLGLFGLILACCGCNILDNLTKPSDGLSIQKFAASPSQITPGTSTTLTWDVAGAETVQIDNGVGAVAPKGSKVVQPSWTTTFTLSAKGGTSTAMATVDVVVQGSLRPLPSPSPSPSPSPTPSPSPSPSPSPTPSPSPSPSPSPTPSPSPSPSPSPGPVSCGTPATSAGGCGVTISHPTALAEGECVELTRAAVTQSCPMAFNTSRSVQLDVTAHTSKPSLSWRRAASSSDLLTPTGGTVAGDGTTTVQWTDVVLDSTVTIEILDGSDVVLSLVLRNY